MILQHLHSLFWDVNRSDFDPVVYPEYTIAAHTIWPFSAGSFLTRSRCFNASSGTAGYP